MLKYDIKQAPPHHVIVEVGAALDDTVTYGNITLHIDPEFNPTHHARIYGRVLALPQGAVNDFDGNLIEPDVKVGDIVYFHYLTTNDESNCIYGNYYKVPYHWVFCAVRDNNILPVGTWTLCEKLIEDNFGKVDVEGHNIDAVISASGIVTKLNKQPSIRVARIAYIGKPFVGQKQLEIGVGDKVVLDRNSNFINKIEGKEYYTVKQEYLLGKDVAF